MKGACRIVENSHRDATHEFSSEVILLSITNKDRPGGMNSGAGSIVVVRAGIRGIRN